MKLPAAELRGIKGVLKAILYWKGTRRFPFHTNPFLVFHPAAELRGILSIKMGLFHPYPNIPTFQYSSIPCMRNKSGSIKRSLILTNCRIPKTFSYVNQ